MELLLDTNALLWWLADDQRLGADARLAIADPRNRIYVSAASAWEMAIKVGLGRLELLDDLASWLPAELALNGFTALPIDLDHALHVEKLPRHHTDPFDRLLVAQALAKSLTIVTADPQFEPYGAPLIHS